MRKYAWLRKPHKNTDGSDTCRIMLYSAPEGFYLFEYSSPEAALSSSDRCYDSLDDLHDDWDDLIDDNGWIEIEDPLPYCQDDALAPIRVKGRNLGKPEWGKYEILENGQWVEYKPQ